MKLSSTELQLRGHVGFKKNHVMALPLDTLQVGVWRERDRPKQSSQRRKIKDQISSYFSIACF